MAADNKSLGRFILDGVPPAPRGVPQVEVTFDVDANGILNVTAKDKASNKTQSIRIEAGSGLSESDIEAMRKDAQQHEDEDKKKKEFVEVKNMAEQLAYTAEKSLREYGDKVTADIKTAVETKITELRTALSGTDEADIKAKTEALSTELQKVGSAMAQSSEDSTSAESGGEGASPEGTVHDAEVDESEKKDDTKE
jgi:molecular chaperone DnaK